MMENLAKELEKVTTTNVINEDFMTTISFSIMGILWYANIMKIVMSSHVLERSDLINKLTTTKEQYQSAN